MCIRDRTRTWRDGRTTAIGCQAKRYPRPTTRIRTKTMANSVTTDRNAAASSTSSKPTGDTLTVVDNRTGKQYDLPIKDGAIRAMDLKQIKTAPDDFGLVTYCLLYT